MPQHQIDGDVGAVEHTDDNEYEEKDHDDQVNQDVHGSPSAAASRLGRGARLRSGSNQPTTSSHFP